MVNEVAGNIAIKICGNETESNYWLKENPDVEIIDVKFSASEENDVVMFVFKNEK